MNFAARTAKQSSKPGEGLVSIIQEIHSWSQNLAVWQQDAIARLYTNRTLTPQDIDDLLALAKSEHGIADPQSRASSKLGTAQLAAPVIPNRLVKIAAIKNLQNVNALAEGQRLQISLDGLTVIFGENGAGKSGYSRVLKQACRARSQSESILPDMRKAYIQTPLVSAIFETVIDGKTADLTWNFGRESPEPLSEIAIFDSHCARAYVDNEGDFAYGPYGLDILEGLAKTCAAVKAKVIHESAANMPNIEPFGSLAKTPTQVGRLLSSISAQTKPSEVEALAAFSDTELERLASLDKALAESDPKQKARILRIRAARFTGLVHRIGDTLLVVDDERISTLRILIEKSKAAKAAAEIAASQFREQPRLLAGTGGEAWQSLFEAARTYAAESHVGHVFPNLPKDAFCPLCQKTLGEDGVARLASFETFIQQEAEKNAKVSRANAGAAYKAIEQAKLDLAIDEALSNELTDTEADLAAACIGFQAALRDRKASVLAASAGKMAWEKVALLSADPRERLNAASATLEAEARALIESVDEKAREIMLAEQAEFNARRRLGEIKATVLSAIDKFILRGKLKSCADSIVTTGISRKSTELSKTMATQEVADALNAELRLLNVHQLQVAMKPESPGGKTQFKLVLEFPGGGNPADILSEGEQRAIAIASFLTEVKLGKGLGGIVFDDPVSSLDHGRRERVASRLAREACDRQVIVLTHDLYFLNVLIHEARKIGLEPAALTLRRSMQGYGVADTALPFEGASTKDRVGQLRQMQIDCARLHKNGDEANYRRAVRDLYSHLRMSWERAVEELLFNGVVVRFRKGVETNRLKKVVITSDDIVTIEQNMGRCSIFTGHDGAMDANPSLPGPDEVSADVEALEVWRKATDERAKKLK